MHSKKKDQVRIIDSAQTSVAKAIEARKKRLKQAPAEAVLEHKPLSSEAQLEREIYLANLALNKYQVKLEDGDELTPEEERIFMSMLDTIRKLETSLAGIKAKLRNETMGPVEIATGLVETGMDINEVLNMYPNNDKVREALEKLR